MANQPLKKTAPQEHFLSLIIINVQGATRKACLAGALGEYFERLSCNYFFADFYPGEDFSKAKFVHYPDERWFEVNDESIPMALLDEGLWDYYDAEKQARAKHLFDINSQANEQTY